MNAILYRALAVERQRDLIFEAERARARRRRRRRRAASHNLRGLLFAGRRAPAPAH
jgi:hypothetical protein